MHLEFAVKAPGFIPAHDWTADSEQIAALVFAGGVHMLDLRLQRMSAVLPGERPSSGIAAGPDGRRVLITAGGEIRAYDVMSGSATGRAGAPLPCLFSTKRGAVFTADGNAVWVRCHREKLDIPPMPAAETPAVLYQIPTLDKLETIPARDPASTTQHPAGYVFLAQEGRPALLEITAENAANGGKTSRAFALECLWLDAKMPCFSPIKLDRELLTTPRIYRISRNLSAAAVGFELPIGAGNGTETHLVLYDVTKGAKSTSLEIPAAMSRKFLQDVAITPNGNIVIAAFNQGSVDKGGGLVAWDARTSKALMIATGDPVESMSISPDGAKIVAISKKEIRIFTLNQRRGGTEE